MRIFLDKNVYDDTIDRLNFIFDEFEEVLVWISGGKDSTVVFNLCMKIAKERGRLPLKVGFIDQESEWEHTIKEVRKIMYRDDVEPLWFQMPFKLNNSTSTYNEWLYCWNEEEKEDWPREKEEISIKENNYGTDLFLHLFDAICKKDFKGKKVANIAGVRCEESPGRFVALTASKTYKHVTWGKKYSTKGHYAFYPIYDWSYTDVWKAIHENNWSYNKIYDFQYMHGLKIQDMRVSSLHHETALKALSYMQEVEPETYNKLVKRMSGINSCAMMGDDFFVNDLPFMFNSWKEYRDFLLDKLIKDKYKKQFGKWFSSQDREYEDFPFYTRVLKGQINAILANDFEGTKIKNIAKRYSDKETRAVKRQKEMIQNEP